MIIGIDPGKKGARDKWKCDDPRFYKDCEEKEESGKCLVGLDGRRSN